MYKNRHITVIIPAHNEQLAIGTVLDDFKALHDDRATGSLVDRIIVCDNASTDNTGAIVLEKRCILVHEPALGYGAACLAGLAHEDPRDIIVFVDADCSAVASETTLLLDHVTTNGADLVIGSRTLGDTQNGALSLPQRWGNALASALIRFFWSKPVTDLGPFRAVTQEALHRINMTDRKYGWTIEMQIRALQENLKMVEVPVTTMRRVGQSKISGTVKGVLGASHGILRTLFVLLWRQHFSTREVTAAASSAAVTTNKHNSAESRDVTL